MFYCPGEHCAKRNQCGHYMLKNSRRQLQLLDMSTNGSGQSGIDENGNYFLHHEYSCGDRAPSYRSLWEIKTWQDKGDFENYNNPAHAEGWAVAPGTLIKIWNEHGEEEVIPFDPKTLKLGTKVDWQYARKF